MNSWSVTTVDYDAMHNTGFDAQASKKRDYKTTAAYASTIIRNQKEKNEPVRLEVSNHMVTVIEVITTITGKVKLQYEPDLMDNESRYILAACKNALK